MPDPDQSPNPERARMRGVLALAVRAIGILALLGLLTLILFGEQHPLGRGAQAPAVTARTLEGRPFSLAPFAGRPMVVNIWATWCPPCLAELPHFREAAQRYDGQVTFVGLATDSPDPEVKALVERFQLPYAIALIDGRTQQRWNATALPSTYLIDRDGKVAWSIRGAIDGRTLDQVLLDELGIRPRDKAP